MPHDPYLAHRRRFVTTACGLAGSLVLPARAQGDFPNRPVRIIVGLPPGGAADIAVRAQSGALEKALKQPVVVENRPGGQFQISMQALMSAPADGHTLLYLYNGYASVDAVQKLFDLKSQLIPVAQIASTPITLMVRGASVHKSMKDMISFGRANPDNLTYATYGPGSVEHLKIAQIEKAAGFKGVAVPYKGGPDVVKALIAGEIDFGLTPGIFAKQYGPSGQLRPLAVLETARWSDFPDVPTLAETGVPVTPLSYWGGYAVRAGTPPDIVQRLFRELTTTAALPSVVERLTGSGGTLLLSKSTEEFRLLIASDVAWMTEAAKGLNIGP